jgi:hypothetical protein
MDTLDRIQDIINLLDDAISYGDMDIVDDARKELVYLMQDLESNYDGLSGLDDIRDEEY